MRTLVIIFMVLLVILIVLAVLGSTMQAGKERFDSISAMQQIKNVSATMPLFPPMLISPDEYVIGAKPVVQQEATSSSQYHPEGFSGFAASDNYESFEPNSIGAGKYAPVSF